MDPILYQHLFLQIQLLWPDFYTSNSYYTGLSCVFFFAFAKKKGIGTMVYSKYTTRASFDFTLFNEAYKNHFRDRPLPSASFLQWFIGFTEGDGCFTVAKRGDISFIITQSTSDIQILHYIQNVLGFGSVIVQSKDNFTHRYVVQDKLGLWLLSQLLNGNLVFPVRQHKFLLFLNAVNNATFIGTLQLSFITPILSTVLPTLRDAWLLGFTDSEGCFTVSLLSNSNAFRIRFILSQKWDENKLILDLLSSLIGGTVCPHSQPLNWELRIVGLLNCSKIFGYFAEFPLKTSKAASYARFLELHDRITRKDHLDPIKRLELKLLAAKVNPKRRKMGQ